MTPNSQPPATFYPIPDREFYTPLFSPWKGFGPFAKYYQLAAPYTLVSPERCWILYCTARQCLRLAGEFWECGVYKGGTARMLAQIMADTPNQSQAKLRLFDTFAGIPTVDWTKDLHNLGEFGDTSLAEVKPRIGHGDWVSFHVGIIPHTFATLENCSIAFAHIDVDVYQPVLDCCRFILPRLAIGGAMVFDDYGFPTCPGARQAVDEFFSATPLVPLVLPTGQAVVYKSL
jgi:O-methyltransferase